jgi:hypothetical protein
MNVLAQLQNYIANDFDGLKLNNALFYQGVPGLRFDLQDESLTTADEIYFKEAERRMRLIHQLTTSPSDQMILLLNKETSKRGRIKTGSYLFKQLKTPIAYNWGRRKSKIFAYPYYKGMRSCQLALRGLVSDVNFENVYKAIANIDFPSRQPRLKGDLYLVNLTRSTITMMYDDRGCNIISQDIPLLKSYYQELSSLILEYDRPAIIERLSITN